MLAFEGLYNAHLYAFLTRTNFEPRHVIIIQIFGDLFNLKKGNLEIQSFDFYSFSNVN